MRTMLLIVGVLSGCGNDIARGPDAPPAGTPLVTVSAPRLNQAFYMTETAMVAWTVVDDGGSATCDITALDGTTRVPIATGVTAASGAMMTTPWTLTSVAVSDAYVAEVRCTDDSSPPLIGTGMSPVFAVVGPPQQVSYAAQVQPIWTAKCISQACHDNTQPQAGLNLMATVSRAEMVGIASQQCPTTQLVKVGDPAQSYLMYKLQGSGPCMTGSRMPKTSPALSAAELQLIRDWIVNGAPNN